MEKKMDLTIGQFEHTLNELGLNATEAKNNFYWLSDVRFLI